MCLFQKTCVNINVIHYIVRNISFFLMKRFEKFKERVKFEFEIAICDVVLR